MTLLHINEPWPFPTMESMEIKKIAEAAQMRKEFYFPVSVVVQLIAAQKLGEVNVSLFWAQYGKEMGFKWWTVSPLEGGSEFSIRFTVEVNNAKN